MAKKTDSQKWWSENYSKKKSGKKMRDILNDWFPEKLKDVKEVYFY
jgi:hypothetical protein